MKSLVSQNRVFTESLSVFLVAEVNVRMREDCDFLFLRIKLLFVVKSVVVQSSRSSLVAGDRGVFLVELLRRQLSLQLTLVDLIREIRWLWRVEPVL